MRGCLSILWARSSIALDKVDRHNLVHCPDSKALFHSIHVSDLYNHSVNLLNQSYNSPLFNNDKIQN